MGRQEARQAALRGEDLVLTAADGHRLQAYRARPDGDPKGGLAVLQEIFGVNAHIRELCDAFAQAGYEALAPALFDRAERGVEMDYGPDSVERGRVLRAAIAWDDMLLDVQAALDALDASPKAAIGYCWGGTLAFLAAARLEGLACAVSYYGGQTVPFAQEPIRVPVLMHFGAEDPRIPPQDRAAIQAGNPAIEMHVFPADHGFNCDHRKEFHAPSADEALRLTFAFLERHFGATEE